MANSTVDIVMFNMSSYSDWQKGIENRNFHILHNLLRSPRVRKIVAVDYLPFTGKRALKQWWQNIIQGVDGQIMARGLTYKLTALRVSEIEKTGYKIDNLTSSSIPFKLFVYTDIASYWSERTVYRRLKRQLDRLGLENIVLWSYLPTSVGYFGQLGERIAVFDSVDNWLEHSSYKAIRHRLLLNYHIIRYQADIIFTTATALEKFFDCPGKCEFVPNGVNLEHFTKPPKLVGRDILNIPHPIIGYIGTIQEDRIDLDLVRYLAEKNPAKSIVMIGPIWQSFATVVKSKLGHLKNVYLLKRVKYQELPSYFMNFAVAIIPHQVNDFTRNTNPMKLYEYLASGKPIVATPTGGVEKFAEQIYLADTPESFNAAVIKALQSGPRRTSPRALLRHHTWSVRVKYMLDKLFAALKQKV